MTAIAITRSFTGGIFSWASEQVCAVGIGLKEMVNRRFYRIGTIGNHLVQACRQGNIATVRHAIEEGLDLRSRDDEGQTLLHIASRCEQPELVRYLIRCGSPLDAKDNMGNTALHEALNEQTLSITQLLIGAGSTINIFNNSGMSPLQQAILCRRPCLVSIEYLLSEGANPNYWRPTQYSPLHLAARKGAHKIVHLLLRHGANPQAIDSLQRSAYQVAADQGQTSYNFLMSANDKAKNAAKVLGHTMDIPGFIEVDQKAFEFEGSLGNSMALPIIQSLDKIALYNSHEEFGLTEEECNSLRKAFGQMYSQQNAQPETLGAQVKAGKLIFLAGGWQGHAVSVFIMNDYLVISNTGQGFDVRGKQVEAFKIDHSRINILITLIQDAKNVSYEEGFDLLYNGIPSFFSTTGMPEKDAICERIEQYQPVPQTNGFCGYESKRAALGAAWLMLKKDEIMESDTALLRNVSHVNAFLNQVPVDAYERHRIYLDNECVYDRNGILPQLNEKIEHFRAGTENFFIDLEEE